MSECSSSGGSGRVGETMVSSLPLASCESSVSVKENPDRKKYIYEDQAQNISVLI